MNKGRRELQERWLAKRNIPLSNPQDLSASHKEQTRKEIQKESETEGGRQMYPHHLDHNPVISR
jgi:hypothetical protein